MGLSANYKRSDSTSVSNFHRLIYAAIANVIRRHPILSAIPIDEDTTNPYFARLPCVDLKKCVFFVQRRQPLAVDAEAEDNELDAVLEDQHNTNFKAEYGNLPFWRLIILQNPGVEDTFTASFIFYHGVGDGVAGLTFHNSFRDALNTISSSALESKTEHIFVSDDVPLLPPLEELHPLPISDIAAKPTTEVLKEWTGNPIHLPCVSHLKSLALSPSTSKAFIQDCKKNNVTVTSALPSLIAAILYNILPPTTEALTCIIPVSLRPWLPRHIVNGEMGTWIDAFKVQFLRLDQNIENPVSDTEAISNLSELWAQAQNTLQAIKSYLTATPSGEPYVNVALFKSIPDVSAIFNSTIGKERDSAFEVSNLGVVSNFTSQDPSTAGNDPVWQVGKVTFSRSSVVSGSAITINVVTGGNGGMTLGFTWQEGIVEDKFVEGVVSGVRNFFEAYS